MPTDKPASPDNAPVRPTALVTGASAGIGAAFADRLARDGFDLILTARRGDRLQEAAARLAGQLGIRATVIVADLTDATDLARVERTIAECASLQFLVNCAGIAGYMPFIELPAEQAASMILLHVVAPTRLTRAALPGMIERGSGVVINVSSGLAFTGALPSPQLPRRAVYASAKAYLNTFTEVLANELRGTGVVVQALCPAVVRTELHEVAGYDVSHVQHMMEPEDVVAASLAGVALGETVCIPSLPDRKLLEDFDAVRARIFGELRSSPLAERYAPGQRPAAGGG